MSDGSPRLKQTPSQTAGPYVHIGLTPTAAGLTHNPAELGNEIAGPEAEGQRIRVEGVIYDGEGAPLTDALIEVWQADAQGHYAHSNEEFYGWGRVVPDFETGIWRLNTIKPGPVLGDHGPEAPHIALWIVARGINTGLLTRLYFDDEPQANATDPVLVRINAPRRTTLIATRDPNEPTLYRFDIHLQGDRETVFFDI